MTDQPKNGSFAFSVNIKNPAFILSVLSLFFGGGTAWYSGSSRADLQRQITAGAVDRQKCQDDLDKTKGELDKTKKRVAELEAAPVLYGIRHKPVGPGIEPGHEH